VADKEDSLGAALVLFDAVTRSRWLETVDGELLRKKRLKKLMLLT
jgi:hypothetical protein